MQPHLPPPKPYLWDWPSHEEIPCGPLFPLPHQSWFRVDPAQEIPSESMWLARFNTSESRAYKPGVLHHRAPLKTGYSPNHEAWRLGLVGPRP